MKTMTDIFYSSKLEEEKSMICNLSMAVIKDEANKQYTICFSDGSIVQHDSEPKNDATSVADSLRFIELIDQEVTVKVASEIALKTRAVSNAGKLKLEYYFSDNSVFVPTH